MSFMLNYAFLGHYGQRWSPEVENGEPKRDMRTIINWSGQLKPHVGMDRIDSPWVSALHFEKHWPGIFPRSLLFSLLYWISYTLVLWRVFIVGGCCSGSSSLPHQVFVEIHYFYFSGEFQEVLDLLSRCGSWYKGFCELLSSLLRAWLITPQRL